MSVDREQEFCFCLRCGWTGYSSQSAGTYAHEGCGYSAVPTDEPPLLRAFRERAEAAEAERDQLQIRAAGLEEAWAENEELRAVLQNVIDSAHTDSDTCPICTEHLDDGHASGCSIGTARQVLGEDSDHAR